MHFLESGSVPWYLKHDVYPGPFAVQVEALKRAGRRNKFLQLLEQGLGKTPLGLNEYLYFEAMGLVDVLVVVCPNSFKTGWADDDTDWHAGIGFHIWDRPVDLIQIKNLRGVVMNWEALIHSGGEALLKLAKHRRVFLIGDEIHRIMNHGSSVSKFTLTYLVKEINFLRGLTGTPMGGNVMHLWPQLRFAGALNGVNPFVFRNRFALMGGFKGKKVIGVKNSEELDKIIASVGFRALKVDWLESLPPKTYKIMRVELHPKLVPHYREMDEELLTYINGTQEVSARMVITKIIKLGQISSGFIKDEEGIEHELCPFDALPKYKALLDILDANGSASKTIVVGISRYTCRNLIRCLTEETGEVPAYIVGGMKHEEIREQKKLFNDNQGPSVIVLQAEAGKEGHTLLGGPERPCFTEVFFENNYKMITRAQVEDRAHRGGQTNQVGIIDIVSSPTESNAVAALQQKQNVSQWVIDKVRGGAAVVDDAPEEDSWWDQET